jgi:hypothetical protein
MRLAAAFVVSFSLAASTARAENMIQIRDAEGPPGTAGIVMLITATNDVPVDAYSLAVTFPPGVVSLVKFDLCGTLIALLEPAFEAPLIDNALGYGTLAVVLRMEAIDGTVRLEPQEEFDRPRVIARLQFDVHSDAVEGIYPIRLVNGVGTRSVTNEFSTRGQAVSPNLFDGKLRVSGQNVLMLERKLAFCEASPEVTIRALARHPDPLVAFSIGITYDCFQTVFDPSRARIGQGVIDAPDIGSLQRVEFRVIDDDDCRVRTVIVPDGVKPFDETPRTINANPDGVTQILMEYVFEPRWQNVRCDGDESIDLELEQREGAIVVNSLFVVDGERSIEPLLYDGKIYLQNGGLTGRVIDATTGEGILGVKVELEPAFVHTETIGPSGTFTFPVLPPGEYLVRFSMTDEARDNPQIGDFHKEFVADVVVGPGLPTDNVLPDVVMYPRTAECAEISIRLIRGDVTGDGRVDIADAVNIFQYLFLGNQAVVPRCLDAADKSGNGVMDLSDGIGLLGYLFRGEPPPADPFPACGIVIDGLGCEAHRFCESQ